MAKKGCPVWLKKVLFGVVVSGVWVGMSVCAVSADENTPDKECSEGQEPGVISDETDQDDTVVQGKQPELEDDTKTEAGTGKDDETSGEIGKDDEASGETGKDDETSGETGKDDEAGETGKDDETSGETGEDEETSGKTDVDEKKDPEMQDTNVILEEVQKESAMNVLMAASGNAEEKKEVAPAETKAQAAPKPIEMYRMYNPYTGEHLYTENVVERNSLAMGGWNYEGVMWLAPDYSKTPVYRLYNPYDGGHHYTVSAVERDFLVSIGWNSEGVGWYSDDSKTVPLYRQFNPYAVGAEAVGAHNYTTSTNERDTLVSIGWNNEGIGWYGLWMNQSLLYQHPMTIYQGFDYASVYDYTWYRDHNPDVVAAYGRGDDVVLKHFVEFGMKEERQANATFNEKAYRYANPDLRRAFYSNYVSYYQHYCENGIREPRVTIGVTAMVNPITDYNGIQYSPIYDYFWFVANHQDLVRALGTDNDTDLIREFALNWIFDNVQAKASYDSGVYQNLKAQSDPMWAKAMGYSSPTGWLLLVNLSTYQMRIYRGSYQNWDCVRAFTVGTGKPSTPTVQGDFRVGYKQLYFDSYGWRLWYATQFYGNYLFHSVCYYPESGPYRTEDGQIGVAVSHGCVRMTLDNSKYIYDYVPTGTRVIVYS